MVPGVNSGMLSGLADQPRVTEMAHIRRGIDRRYVSQSDSDLIHFNISGELDYPPQWVHDVHLQSIKSVRQTIRSLTKLRE